MELRVLGCWEDHQGTKVLSVRGVMGPSYALRHRMLHFLQNFVYYMCLEVIGPRAHEMKEGLDVASNMDEVIGLHDRFLDLCLKECLLASQNLLKILTKLMTTCLLFSDQMKRFAANLSYNETEINRKQASIRVPPTPEDKRNPSTASEKAVRAHDRKTATKRKMQTDYIVNEVSHDAYKRLLTKFSEAFDAQVSKMLLLIFYV